MEYIPSKVKNILEKLENNGFEAYLVGGSVRDILMDKKPDDFDITTSATPDEVKSCFKNQKVVETGLSHGTVTIIFEGESFEITTFRTEGTYSDNRHPDSVRFTRTLEDDLSRRDFTVNSIALDKHGAFTDPFSGIKDIRNKVIRTVGNPANRFNEDALRILRALRFSSVLNFKIEENTAKAIHTYKHLLKNISEERIFSEFTKLLCGINVKNVLLDFSDVLAEFIPEVGNMEGFEQKNFHHIYDVLTHTAVVTESIEKDPVLRLSAFFHDIGKPFCFSMGNDGQGHFYSHPSKSAKITENSLIRLKCDTKTREAVVRLVKVHDTPIEETEKYIKRRLGSMGEELFFKLLCLQRADTKGLAPEFSSRTAHFDCVEKIAKQILLEKQCFSLKDLAVNGYDLIEIGCQGKEIGLMLNMLLDSVIDGKVKNKKNELMKYTGLLK